MAGNCYSTAVGVEEILAEELLAKEPMSSLYIYQAPYSEAQLPETRRICSHEQGDNIHYICKQARQVSDSEIGPSRNFAVL